MITFKPNRFQSVNGEDRGGGEVWVVFVGVGGDEREMVMVFLYCVDLVSFFVYGIVLDVCLFDFDFSGDCVIKLFGK